MPFSSVAEFLTTESPTDAERALIAKCQAGSPCDLPLGTAPGQATLPPEGPAPKDRQIRAALLRLLILGGTSDCNLHSSGVWLEGAHITGMLDLRFCQTRGQCCLNSCRFEKEPQLTQAHFSQLSLNNSFLPGLFAPGITVSGSVFLRGLISTGTVDLCDANISGQVSCSGADIDGGTDKDGTQQEALKAQGVQIGSSLFMTGSTAKGTVNINGARVMSQFECEEANFDGGTDKDGNQFMALYAQGGQIGATLLLNGFTAKGTVNIAGARVMSSIECTGADFDGGTDKDGNQLTALIAQGLHVAQGFVFRQLKSIKGEIHLASAHVGVLVDDGESWPKGRDQLYLNGFTYDRIGDGAQTFAGREEWLANGSRFEGRFYPQPYTQFARVLREAGHSAEARRVLMARDRLLFAESHRSNCDKLNKTPKKRVFSFGKACLQYILLHLWDGFSKTATGYGHAPQRSLYWSLACIAIGAVWFSNAWQAGVMVPNSAVILTSQDWLTAIGTPPINPIAPTAAWAKLPSAQHYETFYSLPYALDVFVPFVSLGQEQAWAATTVTRFGCLTRWFTFAYQIAGWSLTAIGIAAVTGFVQKNQPD